MTDTQTLIIHVDVDAFFASVEQLLIPALRGRPVVVGSGCIASCSYEARRFGLRAGMPLARARRLCPRAVILAGHQHRYRCFAEQIWTICRRYCLSLETYLDEAHGELVLCHTQSLTGETHAGKLPVLPLGRRIQAEIMAEAHLPVSIGIGANRMLAKLASHVAKPGGVVWIRPEQVDEFLAPLPVEDLLGVGGKTARLLADMNVKTVADLRRLPREALASMLGRRGEVLYERCRGRDPSTPSPTPRPPRSISRETTFHQPTCRLDEIRGMLFYLLERAMATARGAKLLVGTVELSVRYDDWKDFAASRTLPDPTDNDDEAFAVVCELLGRLHRRRVALRHVGIVLSNFRQAATQGRLLEPPNRRARRRLYGTVDVIRGRFGHAAVVSGESIKLLGKLEQNDYGFVLRTPSLTK